MNPGFKYGYGQPDTETEESEDAHLTASMLRDQASSSNALAEPATKAFLDAMDVIGRNSKFQMKHLVRSMEGCVANVVGFLGSGEGTSSFSHSAGLALVELALKERSFTPGRTVLVEAGWPNDAVLLAGIAAAKGLKMKMFVVGPVSAQSQTLIDMLGCALEIIEPRLGIKGALHEAKRYVAYTRDTYLLGLYEKIENPLTHFKMTGPEIWRLKPDILVAAGNTWGLATGVAKDLTRKNPGIQIIFLEPIESQVMSGGKPGPHNIQGIGSGFVPLFMDHRLIDEVIPVSQHEAEHFAHLLFRDEIMGGMSSGAVAAVAAKVARRKENAGKTIVAVLPSVGTMSGNATTSNSQAPHNKSEAVPSKPANYSGSPDIWERDQFLQKLKETEIAQLKVAEDLLAWVNKALEESEKLDEQIALVQDGVAAQRTAQNASIDALKAQLHKLNR